MMGEIMGRANLSGDLRKAARIPSGVDGLCHWGR